MTSQSRILGGDLWERGPVGEPGGRADTSPGACLPYRGTFGAPRPAELARLPLPPGPMPSHDGLRPLKAWRYIGVYGPELMLCAAIVRIGRARQAFWALWDRERLTDRTSLLGTGVTMSYGRLAIAELGLEVTFEEQPGIEAVCPSGDSYAWTRKQGGIPVRGLGSDAHAVIDDTAGYYQRHTSWRWSAGVGTAADGRTVAWNLVDGVNDPPKHSERTVWIDGEPSEPPPSEFHEGGVDGLVFHAEATRERSDNFVLLRSRYRQPFGTFSGELPGAIALANGYGVMEDHEAWW